MLVKAVSFRLEGELPAQARFLLEDFRLAVNSAIRAGLQTRLTSRYALGKLATKAPRFRCEGGWRLDRHINASLNLLQTAVSKEMVGGLRFDPGALQHDVMTVLCAPRGAYGLSRMERVNARGWA